MSDNGGSPCGACRFLRRKCVTGCVFAPYFEPDDRGTADFEAVHRVFGAKNAAKLLLRTPANKRLDAVVSMCYEALSRVRDPVYGCVAHVFTLQQQVDNLQAELAYVQARLSILKHGSYQLPMDLQPRSSNSVSGSSLTSLHFGQTPVDSSCLSSNDNTSLGEELFEEDDLEILARELVTKYLPVPKI
ncbi:LOB domain-containing protein 19 [Artemisia annua]|uniref:LOB domain-containing protein 19 n=1 Tax=Artemisia annua TaxID=35608 RepID=A0A2U1MBL9_ARTAN|nr:LOB domain-containing protein 19 [Artemisia annua]